MIIRRAQASDAFSLMRLYQLAPNALNRDSLLVSYNDLIANLESPQCLWLVAEDKNDLVAAVSIQKDTDQYLYRFNRLYFLKTYENDRSFISDFFDFILNTLHEEKAQILYTVTRLLSPALQEVAREKGFKLLGLFPNSLGGEYLRLVGLQAYFFQGVLSEKNRYQQFSLHPMLEGLYGLVKRECNLSNLNISKVVTSVENSQYPTPSPLEYIVAPFYILEKFEELKEMKSLSIHFYPFQNPNAVIVDPKDQVAVFLRVYPELRYAMIIGERILSPINPTVLYRQVAQVLREKNISHIEMINDSADIYGVEAITQAGFVPCAYFPSLKRIEDQRRDFIVFSRCYEKIFESDFHTSEIHAIYSAYLQEFRKIESSYSFY